MDFTLVNNWPSVTVAYWSPVFYSFPPYGLILSTGNFFDNVDRLSENDPNLLGIDSREAPTDNNFVAKWQNFHWLAAADTVKVKPLRRTVSRFSMLGYFFCLLYKSQFGFPNERELEIYRITWYYLSQRKHKGKSWWFQRYRNVSPLITKLFEKEHILIEERPGSVGKKTKRYFWDRY